MSEFYRRNYHPLIILLYHCGMLGAEQLNSIPKTTKYNWNQFKHENYYGAEIASAYIEQFEQIKDVYASKYIFRTVRFLLKIRSGYHQMLQDVQQQKKLLRENADSIVDAVDQMVSLSKLNVTTACKIYGVSRDWYYIQKRKIVCSLSPFNKCYRLHPNQLTQNEVAVIENLVTKSDNMGKTKVSIYYQAMKDNILTCGLSTFNKYASALGYKKIKRMKLKYKIGFRASRVFEWLHVDITNVPTLEGGIQKVAFVKDNFSRAILHYASTDGKAGSEFIATLFQETFEKFQLFDIANPIHILSDGGSENKGELLSWVKGINAPPVVSKITAKTEEFPFSNSMSESTHSIFKTEFLKGKISQNRETHLKDLEQFYTYYNYERFPCDHKGLRPIDVLNGDIPNKDLYKERIKLARIERIQTNQAFNECGISMSKIPS